MKQLSNEKYPEEMLSRAEQMVIQSGIFVDINRS